MTEEEKNRLNNDYFLDYLTRTRGDIRGQNINCPFHDDKTPSATVYPDHLYCRGSCGKRYDLYDLIQLDYRCNYPEALKKAQEMYGHSGFRITAPVTKPPQKPPQKPVVTIFKNYDKFTILSEAARTHYHKRGLTDETIQRFKLGEAPNGTDELFDGAGYPGNKIPFQEQYQYLLPILYNGETKYIVAEMSEKYRAKPECASRKYGKPRGLTMPYWNEELLLNQNIPAVIFVCEGIYDALSVEQAGYKAIALIGTAYSRLTGMLKAVKDQGRSLPKIIIALDSDEAGQNAAKRLKQELDGLTVENIIAAPLPEAKDWNELLQKKGTEYVEGVCEKMVQSFGMVQTEQEPELEQEQIKIPDENSKYQESFNDYLAKLKGKAEIHIGFEKLTSAIGHSLTSGLVVIGAAPSAGKTALTGQIVHNRALDGKRSLIISLEMSRNELIARDISRHTLYAAQRERNGIDRARTIDELSLGEKVEYRQGRKFYAGFDDEDKKIIEKARKDYFDKIGNLITVFEADEPVTPKGIEKLVKEYVLKTGEKNPFIVVDFLQLVAPDNERADERKATSELVRVLKKLTRQYNACIWAISSTARSHYNHRAPEGFGKESGELEYTADVTLYLQYKECDVEEGSYEEQERAKGKLHKINGFKNPVNAREMVLTVIKNRHGERNLCIGMLYLAPYFYFEECDNIRFDKPKRRAKPQTGGLTTDYTGIPEYKDTELVEIKH